MMRSTWRAFTAVFIFLTAVGCSNPLGGGGSKIDEDYNPGAPGAATATGVTAAFDEDTESSAITLAYSSDADTIAQSCEVSDLINVTVTEACACIAGTCSVKVQAANNFFGSGSFSYTVTDQEGRISNSATADLTISAVNDAPVLAPIANQSILAGQTVVVNLDVSDIDSVIVCSLAFQTPSTNIPGTISAGNIAFGETAPNCTATISPIANQRGNVTLGFTATDGGLTSSQSFSVSVTSPPAIPTGLAATSGNSQVGLTWAASAIGYSPITYTVYRSTSSGIGFSALAACSGVSATNCTDSTASNGTTYYYVVRANNVDGTSNDSNEVSARPLQPPSAPTLSRAITTASRIDLSWVAGSGTAPFTYTVQRSTTSGSGFANVTGCVAIATTTCNDTTATAGTTYYYTVTQANLGGSATSNEISAVPIAAFAVTLTPGNRQIQASFSSAGASTYRVQYGTSPGSYSTTIDPATSPATVSSLVNGTTYYILVTAMNVAGSASANAEVSATPNGPAPFTISDATAGNGQVALTWTASSGATSYTVKFGTSSGSYADFATGLTGTSSTVTGLANGTTYYFMVTAVNANGGQDAMTEFVRTPALPTLSVVTSSAYDSANNRVVTPTMTSNWSANVGFALGGLSTFTCNGNVAATSSNTAVVPNAALTVSGTYPNCNLNLSVAGNMTGSTTITLTATYGSTTATRNFEFYFVRSAASVYSTRLAVLGYTGHAIRVRHGTSNAQANVAFDADGTVSASSIVTVTAAGTSGYTIGQTMAFSSFYAAATVFVVDWYDQSGNLRTATQATAGNQPRIVSAGTLDTANSGRTGIRWFDNSSNRRLVAPAPLANANEMSVNMVYREIVRQNSASWDMASDADGGRISSHMAWGDGTLYWDIGNCCAAPRRYTAAMVAVGSTNVYSFLTSTAANTKFLYRNGNAIITGSSSTATVYRLSIGGGVGMVSMNALYTEFTVFPVALGTTDRQRLEQVQKSFFSTP